MTLADALAPRRSPERWAPADSEAYPTNLNEEARVLVDLLGDPAVPAVSVLVSREHGAPLSNCFPWPVTLNGERHPAAIVLSEAWLRPSRTVPPDSAVVKAVLAHELAHVITWKQAKYTSHGPPFREILALIVLCAYGLELDPEDRKMEHALMPLLREAGE